MITPIDILDAREDRSNLQKKIIDTSKLPLLVMRSNYPGIEKNNDTSKFIVTTMLKYIKTKLEYKSIEKIDSYEGLIFLLTIDLEPQKIKEIVINIENNHPLGRLLDLDVIDINNNPISRTDLGYSPRTCYLCDELAHNCVRSQKHSLEEVVTYIEKTVKDFKN